MVVVCQSIRAVAIDSERIPYGQNNGINVPVVGVDGWARINEHNAIWTAWTSEWTQKAVPPSFTADRSRPVKVTGFMDECKRGTGLDRPQRMLRKAMIQMRAVAFTPVMIQTEAERIVGTSRRQRNGKQAGNVNSASETAQWT